MRHVLLPALSLLITTPALAQFGPAEVLYGNFPGVMSDARFADIDQDGTLDMVCSAPYESAVMWYRGHGTDRHEPGRSAIAGLNTPSSFDLWDLDGDGVDDLVVTVATDDRILWARNNGFGEFPSVDTLLSTMDQPAWVRVVDVDGDGDPDIVAASTLDDRIAWFANLGGGQFGPQQDITTTADGITRATLGDVDNDGDVDVLAALPGTQTLGWYANDGSGQFSALNTIGTGLPVPLSAELADMNGDGWNDVLFAYSADDLVWFPGTGNGTFGTLTPIAVVNGLKGAWAADLDGDGDLDILAGHASSARLYANDGTGAFTQQTLSFAFAADAGILQDLNNDGLVDLGYRRVSNQDVSYRYNLGSFTFSAETSVPAWYRATGLGAADMDGDGDVDLMVRGGTFAPVTLFVQEENGVFTPTVELFFGTEPITNFILQDMDQDGLMDVLFRAGDSVDRDLYWKRNLGGSFGPEVLLNTYYLAENLPITLADVDGDGDMDHLVSSPNVGWRRNDGSSFSAHITIDASITRGPMALADLNGDGLNDVIAANGDAYNAKWYRNNGNTTFTAQPDLPTSLDDAVQIHPQDLDNDGDLDLVINGAFNAIAVTLNNGNGTFGPMQGLNTWNWTSRMFVFDVDGDGDPDIMNGNYTQFRWCANNGLGQFSDNVPLQPDEPYSTELLSSLLADLDGDGLLDIVYAEDVETQLEWLPNRANTYFRIQGRLFWDQDEDGVRDVGELPVPWASVSAEPAPNFPFSSNNGAFLAYVDAGTFTVRPVVDTELWRITSDSLQYTVTLDEQNPVSAGNDFGLYVNEASSVLDLDLMPPNGVCADTVSHWITVSNLGNILESGVLALEYDTLFTLLAADPPPDSVVADTYYWSYAALGYYGSHTIQLTSVRPDFNFLGDSAYFALHAYRFDPFVPGIIIDTTSVELLNVIQCSYDPNDKLADPAGYGAFGAVDLTTGHIDYTIRFQNTGNAPAVTVVLRDTLPAQADLERLTLLGYSFAPTDLRVDSGNVLVVRLQGILLPDSASDPLGSQGFVSFRMGLQPDLPHLTAISNTAGIYFDYNPPIITNTTVNTLVDCALWQPQIDVAGFDGLSVTAGDHYQWSLDGEPIPDATQQEVGIIGNGTYSATVTSVFGCIATAEFQVISAGVDARDAPAFGIVPNPMTGDAVLWSTEPLTAQHRIELLDAQGRLIRTLPGQGSSRVELARAALTPGFYSVLITAPDGERSMVRLVVQ